MCDASEDACVIVPGGRGNRIVAANRSGAEDSTGAVAAGVGESITSGSGATAGATATAATAAAPTR